MSGNIDDDDTYDDNDNESLEEYSEIENKVSSTNEQLAARRRLEELREQKELERMLKGDFEDFD